MQKPKLQVPVIAQMPTPRKNPQLKKAYSQKRIFATSTPKIQEQIVFS